MKWVHPTVLAMGHIVLGKAYATKTRDIFKPRQAVKPLRFFQGDALLDRAKWWIVIALDIETNMEIRLYTDDFLTRYTLLPPAEKIRQEYDARIEHVVNSLNELRDKVDAQLAAKEDFNAKGLYQRERFLRRRLDVLIAEGKLLESASSSCKNDVLETSVTSPQTARK